MRILSSTILLLIFSISLTSQSNPNREYWTTKRWQAKAGQGQDFRAAASEKTSMFNMSPETSIITYRVVDGPDQGMFERVQGPKTMDQLFNQDNSAGIAHWQEHVMPHVQDSEGAQTWWRIKGLCINWEESATPAKHVSILTFIVETGKMEDVRRFLNRRSQVLKKFSKSPMGVFGLSSGGQTNTFRVVTMIDPSQTESSWTSENSFEDEYNTMFGYNARQVDRRAYNEALLPWGKFRERMQLVPEMSYMGPQ